MASIKVLLNTYRPLKDGTYPLVFQILHKRKKRLIYSPYHLPLECFDKKKMQVVSYRGNRVLCMNEINDYIFSTLRELNFILSNLENERCDFSVSDIADLYRTNKNNSFLFVYMRKLILRLKEEGKSGTSNAYQSTLNSLLRFQGNDENLCFRDVTVSWLNEFVSWHYKSGLKFNTVNFYLRILRAVYNRALNEGVFCAYSFSPFSKITFGNVSTVKRAVDGECINQIVNAKVDYDSRLALSRDLFLFSFYSRGMSFVDMAFLKSSNISNGSIFYFRSKTKQPIRVKIVAPLQKLIDKYYNGGEYILPILSPESGSLYNQYRSGLKRYNSHLKSLSIALDLKVVLTSYVARHSWATLARKSGIPVSVISEGLGHRTEKITYTYLAALDPSAIDFANEIVANTYS